MINSRSWEDVLDLRGAYMKTGGKDLRVWECVSGMHSGFREFLVVSKPRICKSESSFASHRKADCTPNWTSGTVC